VYEVLRPLERLYEHPAPQVRAAALAGVGEVYCPRSFILVRKGLADPVMEVSEAALRALRELRFRDGFDHLTRFFRDSTDERVRVAALETIAKIGSVEAGLFLLDVVRNETGHLRRTAEAGLIAVAGDELSSMVRQVADLEVGERRASLEQILKAMSAGG
jgi:HEAT repeat protein